MTGDSNGQVSEITYTGPGPSASTANAANLPADYLAAMEAMRRTRPHWPTG